MTEPKFRHPTDSAGTLGGARAPRVEDPLAELARLIGQEDPFKDFPRADESSRAAPASSRPADPFGPVLPDPRSPSSEPRVVDGRFATLRSGPSAASASSGQPAPARSLADLERLSRPSQVLAAADSRQAAAAARPAPTPPPTPAPPAAPPSALRSAAASAPAAPAAPPAAATPAPAPPAPPAADERYRRYSDYEETQYDRDYSADTQGADPYYSDDGQMPPHGEEVFEDQPRARSRTGLVVVGAVVGLAVLGTGTVFGYRALFGSGGQPPVIRADGGPNKVAPSSAQDPSGQKLIYDRVGGAAAGGGERVVSREEQPVDLGRPGQPRVVLPATGDPQNPNEPKRVRTMTVTADGRVVPNPPAPTTPVQTRVATQGQIPPTVAPSAPPAPVAPRPAAPAQPTAQPAATGAGAPLALGPGTNRPAPAAPIATAPAAPPAPPAQAQPQQRVAVATPPPAAASGNYFVQVSAQRSEGEAQAALRSIQSRFSSVLGGQPTTIRRADLGDRGTFFRAHFGPYASREQANEICTSLKSAGGDCVVQRN